MQADEPLPPEADTVEQADGVDAVGDDLAHQASPVAKLRAMSIRALSSGDTVTHAAIHPVLMGIDEARSAINRATGIDDEALSLLSQLLGIL